MASCGPLSLDRRLPAPIRLKRPSETYRREGSCSKQKSYPLRVFFQHHCYFYRYLLWHFACSTWQANVLLPFRCNSKALTHGFPRYGATLSFVVKAFDPVKHEYPATSKRQIGVICQSLYTEAITFCHSYDGAMCSDLLRHPFACI